MAGIASVAGIGFTVSLFVAGLAFDDVALEGAAKVGILAGSLVAAVGGTALLARTCRRLPDDGPIVAEVVVPGTVEPTKNGGGSSPTLAPSGGRAR